MVAHAFSKAFQRSDCQPASGVNRGPYVARNSISRSTTASIPRRARVLNRATAKRCKPRSENHAGVHQIGIFDHALTQHRNSFIDQRQQQPVLKIGWHCTPAASGFCGLSLRQT